VTTDFYTRRKVSGLSPPVSDEHETDRDSRLVHRVMASRAAQGYSTRPSRRVRRVPARGLSSPISFLELGGRRDRLSATGSRPVPRAVASEGSASSAFSAVVRGFIERLASSPSTKRPEGVASSSADQAGAKGRVGDPALAVRGDTDFDRLRDAAKWIGGS